VANTQIFYVYEHWRLDRDECFYVGKGRGRRAYARDGRNTHWANIVSKLERTGFGYEVRLVSTGMSEQEAFQLEVERISFWKDKVELCNKTNGGDGVSGFVMSDETKRKMSEKAKGRPGVKSMLNRKHSEETRLKMSLAHKGKKKSLDHSAKVGAAHKGRKLSEEHKAKMSQAKKGCSLSDAHRAKLAEAAKRQWSDPMKRPNRNQKMEA
jgi:hypothetical protein